MDHYTTLGITKNATPEEIKKAYRKLASQHHPDKGGDTAVFQQIEEAHRILSDPEKKAQYDTPSAGPAGFHFSARQFEEMFGGGAFPGDIFSQIFAQRNGNPFANQHNQKHVFRTNMSITLADAYLGTTQTLKIQTPTGQKVANIDIPKGIQDRAQIRYDTILDNATLVIDFTIQPHLKFERRGNDLISNQTVSVFDLIVGGELNFVTMSGKELEVTIPPKTQPHMQLRIHNQGMPITGTNNFGDQILLLKPFIPAIIDDEITQSILRSKSK